MHVCSVLDYPPLKPCTKTNTARAGAPVEEDEVEETALLLEELMVFLHRILARGVRVTTVRWRMGVTLEPRSTALRGGSAPRDAEDVQCKEQVHDMKIHSLILAFPTHTHRNSTEGIASLLEHLARTPSRCLSPRSSGGRAGPI